MYEYFRGTLTEVTAHKIVVEVAGIGYQIHVPLSTHSQLPALKEAILLYTALIVKESSQSLFGFISRDERDLFEKLITFSGIGPKTALNLLGRLDGKALFEAVAASDVSALAKVPGIGKKTAEKLLVDLKGQLESHLFSSPLTTSLSLEEGQSFGDAAHALVNLGYSKTDAIKAVQKALKELPEDVELPLLIQKALSV